MIADRPRGARLFHKAAERVTTRRGRDVHIRHIRPADAPLLEDLFERLSPETRRLRFMMPVGDPPADRVRAEARRLADVRGRDEDALVATAREGEHERIVAVARLCRSAAAGELAIVVRDDYQGEGLGRVLLDRLIKLARAWGVARVEALTLSENTAMRQLLRTAGLPLASQTSRGETLITLAIE